MFCFFSLNFPKQKDFFQQSKRINELPLVFLQIYFSQKSWKNAISFFSSRCKVLASSILFVMWKTSIRAVFLNLLSSKSRLKASFKTAVPVKEICQLFVAVMFKCMIFYPFKILRKCMFLTETIKFSIKKQDIYRKYMSNQELNW